jgi:hypothetical protein
MGYESPAVGGWVRMQHDWARVAGEVDNSQKQWLDNGLSWRVTATADTPAWRGLSALAATQIRQHRNDQWTKTGWSAGPGVRWRWLYSYYLVPDTSPNRTQTWASGAEITSGRWFTQVEYARYWFTNTNGSSGWALSTRLGYLFIR